MPKSRTKAPLLKGFGGLLRELHSLYEATRGTPMSHDAVARVVIGRVNSRIAGPRLSFAGSTLWRWEEGQVGSPDPLALRELAALYRTDFGGLLAVLITNRERPDLTTEDARRVLEEGPHGASASIDARLYELERASADRDALIVAMQEVQMRLANALAAHGGAGAQENAGASAPSPASRGRHRKTRG